MFSTTPIILAIVLTVATCFIAYWADNLGKNLGKKRLSLFGLRPRQTATAISMATSVGIMAITLVLLTIFSESFRNALLHYDQVRHDANVWRRQAAGDKAAAGKARAQLDTVGVKLKATEKQLYRETQSAIAAQKLTIKARSELTSAQRSLGAARRAETAARSGQAAARRSEMAAQRGESSARAAQNKALRSAEELRVRLVSSRRLFESIQQELATNDRQLKRGRHDLKLVREQLVLVRSAGSRLVAINANLIKRETSLQKRVSELQKRSVALETLLPYAQKSISEATAIATDYGDLVGLLGAGKIGVGLGQVFAEKRVAAASDPARLRVALRELLDEGADEARRFGAQPFVLEEGGQSRALHLAPRFTGQQEPVSEDAQIEQLANHLSTFTVPVSIRASAARNYAEGESQIFARVQLVPVKPAFVSGETITSSVVDGTATDAQLFNVLLALVNAGEQVARRRGMAPLITEKNPNFYAEGTNERIFDALRDVQMQAKQVRVRLLAAEDATTVDNLRIRFVIERSI